ncbi:ecdysteroid kinase domain-containing protein [Phthorimaea operculella]|nr:ecdysteroid kinase domain-containing protein [Phthorimaea operculella]
MELLNQEEICSIVKPLGSPKVLNWSIENYSDELIGYLGEHLRLNIEIGDGKGKSKIKLFVKCMPRFDEWKAQYLKELSFFKKEYIMLSDLFQHFQNSDESHKWRPNLYFIREDLFVFEDVAQIGYQMPSHRDTLSEDEIRSTIETIAKFHAQSIIFEETKSKELNRPYRIWEDYKSYLQEPPQGQNWRDTGRRAVVDYLKEYSAYKTDPNFIKRIEIIIPMLFEGALTLMKPSSEYRNVVVHRDLWTNNIFLKKEDSGKNHALLVDFQTVLYASPMLDISSVLFFNTTRSYRDKNLNEILDFYYGILNSELKSHRIDIDDIFDKATLHKAYDDSVMFGITQAVLIVPFAVMDAAIRKQVFSNPDTIQIVNEVSRSREFIEVARHDELFRHRMTELTEEIVERFVFTK